MAREQVKVSRQRICTPHKNIVCDVCDVRFTQRKALYVHIRRKHNVEPLTKKEGKVKCFHCEKMLYDKWTLRRHCRTAHGFSPERENRLFLRRSVVKLNQKPRFILKAENEIKNNGLNKITTVDENDLLVCALCQEVFTHKKHLIQHISDVHNEIYHDDITSYNCFQCDESFSNKGALLNHTINHIQNLEKFPKLEEILPDIPNYQYEVAQYAQINDNWFIAEIFCNIKCHEDVVFWLSKFGQENTVTFRKMRRQWCQTSDRSYVLMIDRYRCQHNTLPKRKSIPHVKHTGCSASVFIRIYQHKVYSELSWSRVRLKHTHNHHTQAAAKFRDPMADVVAKFRTMFAAGKGPAAALKEHVHDLQLTYGEGALYDRGRCPTKRWVYNFYKKLTKADGAVMQDSIPNDRCQLLSQEAEADCKDAALTATCASQLFKSTLDEFERSWVHMKARIIQNPHLYVDAMREFVHTYRSSVTTSESLNESLKSFGKSTNSIK